MTNLKKDILLSPHTTIGLGGNAKYFLICRTSEDITGALIFAKENNLRVQVISGGSNIIFPDEGFEGLVLKIDVRGIEFTEDGDLIYVRAAAGENWDDFVKLCIEKSLTGVECLSGIPGSVGATPIQNVGAYGQEVKDKIVSVKAIDRNTLENISFENPDCRFGYRSSRFKAEDKDKYIINAVTFRFEKNKEPEIKYPELQKYIDSNVDLKMSADDSLNDRLTKIRNAVISLRKSKSMIIDSEDPNSRSCGSFFMNPVLSEKKFEEVKAILQKKSESFPVFKSGDKNKLSAAWLVEKAGFNKGYIEGGVGISGNHSLALINKNGTTKELLSLANEIEKKVNEKFGIRLVKEPEIVSS